MAQPVLVKTYSGNRTLARASSTNNAHALPPISSYAFADILRAADNQDFQTAIDGIAEICAKNRMSLADEYASHLPPLGEITAVTSSRMRPHMFRPGMRRAALSSVAEASSGSSEGSRKSRKRGRIFTFRKQEAPEGKPMRRMRIGSNGRTIAVDTTTAMASEVLPLLDHMDNATDNCVPAPDPERLNIPRRTPSAAETSLQRLLSAKRAPEGG